MHLFVLLYTYSYSRHRLHIIPGQFMSVFEIFDSIPDGLIKTVVAI